MSISRRQFPQRRHSLQKCQSWRGNLGRTMAPTVRKPPVAQKVPSRGDSAQRGQGVDPFAAEPFMSKSYDQIVKQIESVKTDAAKKIDALKAEAEKLRQQEIAGVVARIREAIQVYGLTAADLGLGRAKAGRAGRRGRGAAKLGAAVKYRDEAGNTWVGRGKRPQWVRDALAAGRTLQDFAVR
jgi:DNA-binding protein H-NS